MAKCGKIHLAGFVIQQTVLAMKGAHPLSAVAMTVAGRCTYCPQPIAGNLFVKNGLQPQAIITVSIKQNCPKWGFS